jgi:glycerol-3-phosphate dehydrogenase (NAD(P)+)
MKIGILGGGSWGSALARHLAVGDPTRDVTIWCHNPSVAEEINALHSNNRFLPDVTFPSSLTATTDLAQAIHRADVLLQVSPSHFVRDIMSQAAPLIPPGVPILNASKGIENDSLMTVSEVLEDVLPLHCHPYLAYLGGPSFALEVARQQPTVVVVAAHSHRLAERLQLLLNSDYFRVYTSIDVIGIELGGALKNVIAIAAGAAEGMGLGMNARAGMLTRGLAEISRLAVRKGANPLTLSGLGGMGDLVLTCYGALSRNRTVGFKMGQGKSLSEVLSEMLMVAEGVKTTRSAHELALRSGVEMPITAQVFEVLYNDKPIARALHDLMTRDLRRETESY